MKYFLIELRDSDGNDCRVFDVLIRAKDEDRADKVFQRMIRREFPKDESDGGQGTFHPCDCACDHRKRSVCAKCQEEWRCGWQDSHGGLLWEDHFQEFPTKELALAQHSIYHSLVDLT